MEPIVISLDGNIGAGKTTLLEALRDRLPDYEIVLEPVDEWRKIRNAEGLSLLDLYYKDKQRWSFTFQNCAILTRLNDFKEVLALTTKRVIITERSVLTDRYVFAEMLRDSGHIDALEWTIYLKWFDTFAANLPLRGIIHLTTSAATSATQIKHRNRIEEKGISLEYLEALDRQHSKWIQNTALPVLEIRAGASVEESVVTVQRFVKGLFV